MKITCQEYNERWEKEGHGYVIRGFADRWLVCDGYAPDCETLIDENAIFCGYVVKAFRTFEEAEKLRNILNA